MVQLMDLAAEKCLKRARLKLEGRDSLEDQFGPFLKRSEPDPSSLGQKWSDSETSSKSVYNPLEEPSPLGLSLRKSPSLLDLIQMKLFQEKKGSKLSSKAGTSSVSDSNKLKASNFPALTLKIGTWEYKSRYEGDLVGKCYFAKHKLVWEVLDGSLKNKIEIQWSDIVALHATYPDDGLGTLNVMLARPPLFFRETNPQPRKHTLWQATSDFTGGQATIHKQHFLQCSQGSLGKHFEKLIQCDPRLNFLSKQPETVLECPYFKAPIDSALGLDPIMAEEPTALFTLGEAVGPPTSSTRESSELPGKKWDQIKVPGIHPSLSISNLACHIEHCISQQANSSGHKEQQSRDDILEEIAQYLLGDSQFASSSAASAEQSLMLRVNSLWCLLQKDAPVAGLNAQGQGNKGFCGGDDSENNNGEGFDASGSRAMTRKDSIGEFLLHLPRITSLPHFLSNLSEDFSSRAR